jgi:hypothetical protein
MHFKWFSKTYAVKCPDGSVKYIYKNIDHAFPLYIPGWQSKVVSGLEGIESIKANISADYTTKIQGLIFNLDEFNQGIMFAFRGAYTTFSSDPCENSNFFSRQIEKILDDQRRLLSLKMQIQALIKLAELHPQNPDGFIPAFLNIVHRIGNFIFRSPEVSVM